MLEIGTDVNVDTVRRPTNQEFNELVEWIHQNASEYDENLPTYVAIFPDYITDCPGYAGKLMVVVWGGGPGFVQQFIWNKSKLEEVENEFYDKRR